MDNSEYILQRIDEYFTNISLDSHDKLLKDIGCEYYPTPIEYITEALNLIKKRENNFSGKTFLDVGCGIGNICAVASHMGLKAEGIELNPVLYDIAKKIYPEILFYNVDIRNFHDYQNYDIIFYYAPFCNEKLQRDLKSCVENYCRIGAYIIINGWHFEQFKDDRFINHYIHGAKVRSVWQKIR